jgi:uncharacterized protein YjbJ (UPF0337 family)
MFGIPIPRGTPVESLIARIGTPDVHRRTQTYAGGTTMSDFEQAKGKIKQAAGDLTDDDELRREGKADESAGKAKEKLADVKDKADDLVDRVKDKLTGR